MQHVYNVMLCTCTHIVVSTLIVTKVNTKCMQLQVPILPFAGVVSKKGLYQISALGKKTCLLCYLEQSINEHKQYIQTVLKKKSIFILS